MLSWSRTMIRAFVELDDARRAGRCGEGDDRRALAVDGDTRPADLVVPVEDELDGDAVVGAQHDDLAVVDGDAGEDPCGGAPKNDARSERVPKRPHQRDTGRDRDRLGGHRDVPAVEGHRELHVALFRQRRLRGLVRRGEQVAAATVGSHGPPKDLRVDAAAADRRGHRGDAVPVLLEPQVLGPQRSGGGGGSDRAHRSGRRSRRSRGGRRWGSRSRGTPARSRVHPCAASRRRTCSSPARSSRCRPWRARVRRRRRARRSACGGTRRASLRPARTSRRARRRRPSAAPRRGRG